MEEFIGLALGSVECAPEQASTTQVAEKNDPGAIKLLQASLCDKI